MRRDEQRKGCQAACVTIPRFKRTGSSVPDHQIIIRNSLKCKIEAGIHRRRGIHREGG